MLRVSDFFLGYLVLMNLTHGDGGRAMVKEPLEEDIDEEAANLPEMEELQTIDP